MLKVGVVGFVGVFGKRFFKVGRVLSVFLAGLFGWGFAFRF